VLDSSRRGIVGVVLAADGDGRLRPWVQWLLGEHVIDRGWSVSPVVGIWEHSGLAGAVANLAAICTWGDWRPPPPAPPQIEGNEGSRPWRRSLQRSAARKAIAHGAMTGVHVLDVGPTDTSSDDNPVPTAVGSGRQMRPHWRAGRWQNYRLATRNGNGDIIGSTRGQRDVDWHYEGRWVRPTLVAAKQGVPTPTTVYVVRPNPEEPGDAERWVAMSDMGLEPTQTARQRDRHDSAEMARELHFLATARLASPLATGRKRALPLANHWQNDTTPALLPRMAGSAAADPRAANRAHALSP
jgi:hypothetical protein